MKRDYVGESGELTIHGLAVVWQGFEAMMLASHYRAVSSGWWDTEGQPSVKDGGPMDVRNMGEMIALMHSELSEALESYRNREEKLWYSYPNGVKSNSAVLPEHEVFLGDLSEEQAPVIGKPEGIASEFADVLIRIFDTCVALDIPLITALAAKHRYNGTRSYRHGNKKA